jgi:hypothetical protein
VFESLVKQNYRHVELSIDPPLFLTKKIPPPPPPFNAAGPTLYTTKISSRISKQTNFVCVCVLCILHHNYFDDDGSPFFSRLKAKQKLLFVPRQ